MRVRTVVGTVILMTAAQLTSVAPAAEFHLKEATIDGIQNGIRSGETTCKHVIEQYIARARAYNGMCTRLVTPDGKSIPAAKGAVRAGVPIKFPTQTMALRDLVPAWNNYKGLVPDYGRLEPTASDPSVKMQYGMVAGIPNAGQVNALETLNVRGERSVTCKGKFDAPPGTPLPPGRRRSARSSGSSRTRWRRPPRTTRSTAEISTPRPCRCIARSCPSRGFMTPRTCAPRRAQM